MEKDRFDEWVAFNMVQICKENNLDMKDWQKIKFFIFEEMEKRFEEVLKKIVNDTQHS